MGMCDVIKEKLQISDIRLELVDFFETKENLVEGTVMAERAKILGADVGRVYAEFIFENEFCIPKEWRNYDLVFPEAKHMIDNSECILYLHYHERNKQWQRGYGFSKFDWTPRARLVRSCK